MSPGEDRNFIAVGRNLSQWYSFIHHGADEELAAEQSITPPKGKQLAGCSILTAIYQLRQEGSCTIVVYVLDYQSSVKGFIPSCSGLFDENLTLLDSERPKLFTILASLNAVGLNQVAMSI